MFSSEISACWVNVVTNRNSRLSLWAWASSEMGMRHTLFLWIWANNRSKVSLQKGSSAHRPSFPHSPVSEVILCLFAPTSNPYPTPLSSFPFPDRILSHSAADTFVPVPHLCQHEMCVEKLKFGSTGNWPKPVWWEFWFSEIWSWFLLMIMIKKRNLRIHNVKGTEVSKHQHWSRYCMQEMAHIICQYSRRFGWRELPSILWEFCDRSGNLILPADSYLLWLWRLTVFLLHSHVSLNAYPPQL